MSVLWCGGEDVDFPNGLGVTAITNAGSGIIPFRSAYARCALVNANDFQAFAKSTLFQGGAVQSAWLSCQIYFKGNGNDKAESTIIGFGKSGTNSGLFLGLTNGQNPFQLQLCSYSGSAITVLAQSGNLFGPSQQRIDLQLINYGSSGTLNLFVAGALLLSFTGNLAIAGVTGFDSVFVGGYQSTVWPIAYISEIIVANESTLGWPGLVTLAPTGNGATQQWTNPDYSNFNPIAINDANSTFTNTVGQDEQATLNALPGTSAGIRMVKVIARVSTTSGAASQNIKLGFNNGTTVGVGASLAATSGFAPVEQYFSTDPTTGGGWGAMTNYQINLRSA